MTGATVAAIDLGASSGRVVVGRFEAGHAELQEVHRFPNIPVRAGGVLRWDVLRLFGGILDGLRAISGDVGPIDSVGVDSWGVDYGLLDAAGQLLGNPAHYRDPRTDAVFAKMLATYGAEGLYGATGIQLQPFNTLFQLRADLGSPQLRMAKHALLIPDLMTYWLSGALGTELTNASTTGLLDSRTLSWSAAVAARLEIPVELFPAIRRPGDIAGPMLPDVAADAGLDSVPAVVIVPSHDTAAAVAGIPATSEHFAFVCTGTWALVGVELPAPVVTTPARAANFTNEVGAGDTIRFLRNVTGFWLLQECVRTWEAEGSRIDLDELMRAAAGITSLTALVDVQEPGFAAPGNMPDRIAEACRRTSGTALSSRAEIARCIIDSMALAVRQALSDATRLSGRSLDVIHIVGGGVANTLFCQLVADACNLPVLAGPTEAASWGNAIYQARALGIVGGSLAEARALIRQANEPVPYRPRGDDAGWHRADEIIGAARSTGLESTRSTGLDSTRSVLA
jgi:rhamnulokinase